MRIIILAAISMIIQDIFEVLKVDAQARNHAILAGLFDSLMYLALVVSMFVSINTLNGHSLSKKVSVLALITAANFIGQGVGVLIGKKYIKESKC